jgi:hypothetical protein
MAAMVLAITIGIVTVSFVSGRQQKNPNAAVSATETEQAMFVNGNETNQIIGVWKLVSDNYGNVESIKIITKSRFIWTRTVNGLIVSSASGTYTFDGETYIENIEFGSQNMSNFLGKKGVIKIRFEGKKVYYSGTLAEYVPLNEIWERME